MRSEHIIIAAIASLALAGSSAAKEKTPPTDPATLKASGPAQRCISNFGSVSTTPAGKTALMFRVGNNSWYRNDLRGPCQSMGFDKTIVFRNASSQYCELDSFSMVDAASRMSFGSCTLGQFTPVEVPKGTRF